VIWWKRRSRCLGTQAALEWVLNNELPSGGIRVHSRHKRAYPEVTGYLIPTLLDYGQGDLAARLARWLIDIQRPEGAFTDPDHGVPHIFDTGQALRGLLAASELVPGAIPAAERAAGYLVNEMVDEGRGGFRLQPEYETQGIPQTIHLYVLPPLAAAAERFKQPDWAAAAQRCAQHYLAHPQLCCAEQLTHFLAYQLEALLDLGRSGPAIPVLEGLETRQRPDGAVPATSRAAWVCVPGVAQLAVCWYKAGRPEPADRALRWLEQHQRRSGGFRGSTGRGADYFPRTEVPWAAKYYLDAARLRAANGWPAAP